MRLGERIRHALARWLYGRNGIDPLNVALIWLTLAVRLAALLSGASTAAQALEFVSVALIIWVIFRMFSRNLPRRRAENAVFLNRFWLPLRSRLLRLKDRKHKYFTCPTCAAVCRVPRGKGNIVITCPKCRAQIRAKS